MKQTFYSLLTVMLLTSALGISAQTRNANDLKHLKDFMEESSSDGKRNIDILWSEAPGTLDTDGSNWTSGISDYVEWDGDRLKQIDAKYKDLVGKIDLSDCTKLIGVYLRNNKLTDVNLKGCTNLQMLYVCLNQIGTLNIEGCVNLKEIAASSNKFTTFDIAGRKELTKLYIPNNKLTSINVKGCTKLDNLTFTKGSVEAVDLSDCANLTRLVCYGNKLSSLDLSKNPKMDSVLIKYTDASGTYTNPLTSVNVSNCRDLRSYDFSEFADLQSLDVSNCGLENLDLSKYTKLKELKAGDQQLTIEEQIAVDGKINVPVLAYSGIVVTPSDNGTDNSDGLITWSNLPSGKGEYSYTFTSTLPEGMTGTPFGGIVNVPWVNNAPVSTIEINNSPFHIYAVNGTLSIQSETPQTVRVYSLTGRLIKQSAAVTDASFALSKGIYIVQLGNKTIQKVVVR